MTLARAAIVMIVLDLVWIRTVMLPRYVEMGRRIQGEGRDIVLRPVPGALAYALMILGLREFVVRGEDGEVQSGGEVVRRGVLFGIVVHGVYNGTGMAVFDEWDTSTALLDVMWGAFMYAVSGLSARSYEAAAKLLGSHVI